MNQQNIQELSAAVKAGQVGVIPTDTIYGVVASASSPNAVERVYSETGRPSHKPFIILISDITQLEALGIILTQAQKTALEDLWPGPVSAILPSAAPEYLHRGQNSLAVRLPDQEWLRDFVSQTGPIIATSANLSSHPTPDNIEEIKKQLPGLDFYVEGKVSSEPSSLVKVAANGELEWITRTKS